MMMSENCLICNTELTYHGSKDLMKNFICPVCGSYDMNVLMVDRFTQNATTYEDIKPKLCSKIYYHNFYHQNPCVVDHKDLETLKTENTSPAQIINRLIEFLYENQKLSFFNSDPLEKFYPVCESFSYGEIHNYIDELERQELILKTSSAVYKRTLKGFEVYEELKKGKSKSNQVFMALQYNNELANDFYTKFLIPALEEFKLDLKDLRDLSNMGELLVAQMEAEIRQSKFLIADITPVEGKNNANVYWEAGLARGLDKPVLYLCEASKFEKLPFDTNGFLHVKYDLSSEEKIENAIKEIKAKIYNTFPNELRLTDNKEKP
jgi:hypothetical protein